MISFEGVARVQKTIINFAKSLAQARLTPSDLSNPVSFQLAFTRVYEAIMKAVEEGGKTSYVAEVRFKDSLGNIIAFAVDLGENPPPFESRKVRAEISVRFYED